MSRHLRTLVALQAAPLLLAAATMLLSGCRPVGKAAKPKPGQEAAGDKSTQSPQGVTIEDDEAKARIRFVGVKGRRGKGAGDVFLLRSWLVRATHQVSHQLYVTDRYIAASARGWNGALGPKGEKLKVTKIESKLETCSPEGCPRSEAYGAAIDDAALRAASATGYAIRFSAESGAKETITLSPEQVRAQIEAIDQKLATLPAAKAQTPKPKKKKPTEAGEAPTRGAAPSNSGY